jgi:hypothetical protein
MKTFTELYMELVSHPEFIHGQIIDKEMIVDELFELIQDAVDSDLPIIETEKLCEKWFEEHKIDIKRNFNKYFEMDGDYYLSVDIKPWLIKNNIL